MGAPRRDRAAGFTPYLRSRYPSGPAKLGRVEVWRGGCRSNISVAAPLQPPGFATTVARTNKPVRPARCCKVLSAGRLVAKAMLELDQGAGKVGHRGHRVYVLYLFSIRPHRYNILRHRTQRDEPFAFFRIIENLPDDVRASKFIDINKHGCPNKKAANTIEDLKEKLRRHLSANSEGRLS